MRRPLNTSKPVDRSFRVLLSPIGGDQGDCTNLDTNRGLRWLMGSQRFDRGSEVCLSRELVAFANYDERLFMLMQLKMRQRSRSRCGAQLRI